MAEVDPKLCIALDDINEAMDCENQDNMGGIIPSVIFGYHADVATWQDYPKKTESPLSLEEAGTLVGDLVMKESCRAYKMDFTDELAEFKITDQGESGGESFLMDLNIISAKMRKKIFGFENATKGRKMFFIVTDNNGTNYLMGDKRRGALRASGDGATTGASSTARNQNTLHYTFTAPRKCGTIRIWTDIYLPHRIQAKYRAMAWWQRAFQRNLASHVPGLKTFISKILTEDLESEAAL